MVNRKGPSRRAVWVATGALVVIVIAIAALSKGTHPLSPGREGLGVEPQGAPAAPAQNGGVPLVPTGSTLLAPAGYDAVVFGTRRAEQRVSAGILARSANNSSGHRIAPGLCRSEIGAATQ